MREREMRKMIEGITSRREIRGEIYSPCERRELKGVYWMSKLVRFGNLQGRMYLRTQFGLEMKVGLNRNWSPNLASVISKDHAL